MNLSTVKHYIKWETWIRDIDVMPEDEWYAPAKKWAKKLLAAVRAYRNPRQAVLFGGAE